MATPTRKSCPTCLAPSRHLTGGAWRCRAGHTFAGPKPPERPKTPATPRTELEKQRHCKDCIAEKITANRPAPWPGPRCTSHHNQRKRDLRLQSKERHVLNTYGLTPEQYNRQLAFQGGKCAICRRATGASKRLAVDHDHACCIGPVSCGRCPRMLLCSTCNDVLAHFRDVPETFERAAAALRNWPTRQSGVVPPAVNP